MARRKGGRVRDSGSYRFIRIQPYGGFEKSSLVLPEGMSWTLREEGEHQEWRTLQQHAKIATSKKTNLVDALHKIGGRSEKSANMKGLV